MPTKNPRVTFTLDQETLNRIDDFRFSAKSKNQTQAILRLLDAGLSAFETETKKAPAPQDSGTRATIKPEQLQSVLKEFGFIRDGEDLSDSDLDFLISVGNIIRAWFTERK